MFRKRSTLYRSGSKRGVSFNKKRREEVDKKENPFRKFIFSKKNKERQRIAKNEKSFVYVCKGDGVADHRLKSMEEYIKYNFSDEISEEDYVIRGFINRFAEYFRGVAKYMNEQEKGFVKIEKFISDYSEIPEIIIEAYVKSCESYVNGASLDKHQFPLRILRQNVKDQIDERCVVRVIKVLKTHYMTDEMFKKWYHLQNIFTLERIRPLFYDERLVKFKKKLPFEDAIASLAKLRITKKVPFKMMDVLMESYDRIFQSAIRRKIDHMNDTDLSLIIGYVMLNVDIYKFPAWMFFIQNGIRKNEGIQTKKEKMSMLYWQIMDWMFKEIEIEFDMEGYVPKKDFKSVSEMLEEQEEKKKEKKASVVPNKPAPKLDSPTKKKIMIMMSGGDEGGEDDDGPPPGEMEEEVTDDEEEEEGEIKIELEEDGEKIIKELTFDDLQKIKKEEIEIERRKQEEALLLEQQQVREKNDVNYKISKTFKGHSGELTSILYFSSVKKLVSTSVDNTLRIWDYQTGECVRTIKARDEIVLEDEDEEVDLTGVILPTEEENKKEEERKKKEDEDVDIIHHQHLVKYDEETFLCCSLAENDRKNVKAYSVIPPDFVKLKEFKSPKLCSIYRLLKLRQRDLFLMMNEENELYVMSYSKCRVIRKLSSEKIDINTQLKNSLRIKSGFYINCSRFDKNRIKLINHEENKAIKTFSKHKKYEIFAITPFLNSENEECILACGRLEGLYSIESGSGDSESSEKQQNKEKPQSAEQKEKNEKKLQKQLKQQEKKKKNLPEAYYVFIYNTTYSKLIFKNPLIKKLKVENGGGITAFCFGSSTRLNDRNYAFLGTSHGTLDIYDITNLKLEESKRIDCFKIHHDKLMDLQFIEFDNYEKNSYDPILTLGTCSGGPNDRTIKVVQVKGVKFFLDGRNTKFVTIDGDFPDGEDGEDDRSVKYIANPHKDDSEEMYLMKRSIRLKDQEIQATMFRLAQKDKRIRELKLQCVKIIAMCDGVLN